MQTSNTLADSLGIEFQDITDNLVTARMPVDERTKQPAGILHGGASAALAETLASVGSYHLVKNDGKQAVGIELSISHLRSVSEGFVEGKATPFRIGKSIHVWQIEIIDTSSKQAVAQSRCTIYIK